MSGLFDVHIPVQEPEYEPEAEPDEQDAYNAAPAMRGQRRQRQDAGTSVYYTLFDQLVKGEVIHISGVAETTVRGKINKIMAHYAAQARAAGFQFPRKTLACTPHPEGGLLISLESAKPPARKVLWTVVAGGAGTAPPEQSQLPETHDGPS